MKNSIWIILFISVLIADLLAVYLNNETLQFISKPLLMPLLAIYLLLQTRSVISNLKIWIILALFFSWLGDILLMFEEKKNPSAGHADIFFLPGLSAFF